MIKSNEAQQKVIEQIVKNYQAGVPKQMLGWYTGAGKTHIFLSVCKELVKIDPKIRIGISSYLHINIKNQTADRALMYLDEMQIQMVEQRQEVKATKNVYIFNPQTLFQRKLKFKFDFLIIDESHIGLNPDTIMIKRIVNDLCKKQVKILGISATPWELLHEDFFKGAVLFKRGLHEGLHDERICPFEISLERFNIDFKKSDYDSTGEVTKKVQQREAQIIKKMCKQKVESLLEKENDNLGSKVLIIVPPGDDCGFAWYTHSLIKNQALVLTGQTENEQDVLQEFKNNPKIRFLIVVNKCQIGFDMPELSSIIDLTMTKKLTVLVQRLGRLARKHPSIEKKYYYYVFDKNREKEDVDVMTWDAQSLACADYSVYAPPGSKEEQEQEEREYEDLPDGNGGRSNDIIRVDFLRMIRGKHQMKTFQRKPFFSSLAKKTSEEDIYRIVMSYIDEEKKKLNGRESHV